MTELSVAEIAGSVALTVVLAVASLALSACVLVRLPADHFAREELPLPLEGRAPWLRWLARCARFVAGLALVALGVALSVPGIPGQGVLVMLVGLLLLEFPGKRRAERWLLGRPFVWRGVNDVRRRFGKPPFVLPASRLEQPAEAR